MITINQETKIISTEPNKNIHISEECIIFLTEPIKNFNPLLFGVEVSKLYEMKISLIYSFDKQNWSKEYLMEIDKPLNNESVEYIEKVVNSRDINFFPFIYVGIKVTKDELFYSNGNIKFNENLPDTDYTHIDFNSLIYDGTKFNNDLVNIITFDTYSNNRFPKWNLYDNMQVVVNQWLNRVDAVTQMYGHTCIYFKTIPKTTNNTLQVVDEKEIVSIKRFMVTFPGNQLPKDTMTYTEWDYAMAEESFAEINWRYFKTVFGETIPEEGDLLFLPIVNKLFKIVHVEPDEDKKFMCKIGWFNAYIQKYTDNDTTSVHQSMEDVLFGFDELNETDQFTLDAVESTQEHLESTLINEKVIRSLTNEEKKASTQNYTNKFKDNTSNVEVKETDAIRKQINKRLQIVSVNPDQNSFPINMYDLSGVTRRVLAMNFSIVDVCRISLLPDVVDTKIELTLNYVQQKRHNGPILDIQTKNGPIITLFSKNDQLGINLYNGVEDEYFFTHTIKHSEYYQANLIIEQKSVHLTISLLRDKQKKLLFQDLYICSEKLFNSTKDTNPDIFTGFDLYGGNFLIGEPTLKFDNQLIFVDYVNPILEMNSFGTTV